MKSGNQRTIKQQARHELGKRDRMILGDVIRYRLLTNEFIHRRYLTDAQPNAVVKVTGRLVRQGWLNAYSLIERIQYLVPGNRLTKLHGLPTSRTRPLGPQSLATLFSIAKYCHTSDFPVRSASEDELRTAFPSMAASVFNGNLAIEDSTPMQTLRLLRIDLGGTPEHIAKKCTQDLSSRQTCSSFNELVSQKRFVLVVITASPTKQELIQKAIAKRQWPKGMRFQVFIVPELSQFLSFQ